METFAWAPALVALAAGLFGGAALAWLLRGTRSITPAEEEAAATRRDLEVHRDTLLDQLRELDDISAGRDPVLLGRERERLELRAARVLAQLDQGAPAPAKARARPAAAVDAEKAAPSGVDARRAARRGFAWGIGSAIAVGGLIVWVSGVVKPRGANGQLTGEVPMRQGPMAAAPPPAEETQPDAELAQLQQAVAQKPDDLDLRLELTQAYLGRRELMKVWEETQEILKRSPGHPRAMSYQALVRLAMGQAGAAEQQLKDAMKAAPDLLEPRLHLSLVYARTGRVAEANKVLDEAERRFPTQKEGLEQLRREMMAQVAQGGGEEGQPPPEAPAARAAGPHVSGEIELDPARGAAPAGAILFLIARAAGQTEGPPLAVKRLPPQFPQRFTLSSEDSMMGQELPAELRVEARLDSDGNPLTRPPSDPTARLDGVRLGDDGLRLRLR